PRGVRHAEVPLELGLRRRLRRREGGVPRGALESLDPAFHLGRRQVASREDSELIYSFLKSSRDARILREEERTAETQRARRNAEEEARRDGASVASALRESTNRRPRSLPPRGSAFSAPPRCVWVAGISPR